MFVKTMYSIQRGQTVNHGLANPEFVEELAPNPNVARDHALDYNVLDVVHCCIDERKCEMLNVLHLDCKK